MHWSCIVARLHFKHLDMAWLALDLMEKDAGEDDEFAEFADQIEKAKIGIEAEMERRKARNRKRRNAKVPCPDCNGLGVTGDARTADECFKCKGTGKVKS